jgi:N-acetylglucosamine-6-phosphate deacetylase
MNSDTKTRFSLEGIHYETGNPVRLEIIDGFIDRIIEAGSLKNTNGTLFIAPGLIDNQINGYAGIDFSGSNLGVKDIIHAAQAIWKEGVTTFLPTLITNSHENFLKNFSILDEALKKDEMLSASVPGFHLEGPYMSDEEGYRGCHPVKYIRKPSREEFMDYQRAAGGKISEITLAPELEGAMEFIRFCTISGIKVALGHTNSSSVQILQAIENGATLSTHLGNGCADFIHRHRNPIWPQLANDHLTPTIIADGKHLLPEELQVFYKVKGPDNIILTSDVIYLSGMAPGKYTFLESEVILTEDGLLYNPILKCMAGASFPLKYGVENMMNFTGCSLAESVNMASRNVARILELKDRGSLAEGKRADLILFAMDGNKITIRKTLFDGKTVYDA